MTAFYNEIDPFAAQWLRNLIAAGHIAPGVVDERSILDIEPYELAGFTQCHFFAGIGVWSYALRQAGWADDRPIWTGSCPCQPFSMAGKQEGFNDARHVWPEFDRLIEFCKPPIVIGEQVENAGDWLDLVSANLEAKDYAFGAVFLPAAGFGGAHIRSRNYWMAYANGRNASTERQQSSRKHGIESCDSFDAFGLGNNNTGLERRAGMPERADQCAVGPGSLVSGLEHFDIDQSPTITGNIGKMCGVSEKECQSEHGSTLSMRRSGISGLDDTSGIGWGKRRNGDNSRYVGQQPDANGGDDRPHAPMLGRDAVDWLFCRDGKWRPVEPGTFPLVNETSSRMGRLRAYGNALDAETATNFCAVVKEICD